MTYVTDDERAAGAAVPPREHDALDTLDLAARAAEQVLHLDRVTRLEVVDLLAHERLLHRLDVELLQQRRGTSERSHTQARRCVN